LKLLKKWKEEELRMAWTKEQKEAINSRGQTLLLSAAAGSGKTAVLVERIVRRLLDKRDPLDITELLVVTFTKAAASEMRERVAAALTQALDEHNDPVVERQLALLPSAHISTLHSFCQTVIRRYFYTIDIDPNFSVAGEEELNLLRNNVMEEVFLSYYENENKAVLLYPLADMFGNDRGDDTLMHVVEQVYDYSRSLPWPSDWLEHAVQDYDIPCDASIDDMRWCRPIMYHIQAVLQEQLLIYEEMLHDIGNLPAFQSIRGQLEQERDMIQRAETCRYWQEMASAVNGISFERLKSLRGLSEEDKKRWELCKDRRAEVKKQIKEELQASYFSITAEDWLQGMRTMYPVIKGLAALTVDFSKAYRLAKKEKGWIDFSDLEHFCLQILLSVQSRPGYPVRSAVAEELRHTFREVLIDEYQDTNGVQELITKLVSCDDNRFMVGDIKQSIYRFRLADPTLFLHKYNTFSRETGAVRRCIDLSKNFRSAPNILAAVNEVFSRAMTEDAVGMGYGEHEKLYAARSVIDDRRWIGGPVEIHLLDTASQERIIDTLDEDEEIEAAKAGDADLTAFGQECLLVVNRLQELKASDKFVSRKDGTMEPLSWRHIVILMRSMAGKADVMLKALQAAGIPSYAEQNGGYFAAVEVQTMLALLQCIDNPEQDLAMAAVLRSPIVGMNEASLARLRLSGSDTLWQNLTTYIEQVSDEAERNALQNFREHMEEWRTFSRRSGVANLLQRLYTDTAYFQYIGGMTGGISRQANLQALYDRARQYEEAGYRGLFRYLKLIDKMRDDKLDLAPAKVLGEGEDVVRVMSIHKSKGLEFPVVIIADMGKNFNRQDMQSPILFHNIQGIGLKQYDPEWRMFYPTFIWNGIRTQLDWEGKAEEQRILYVAMTRARDKLILTGHSSSIMGKWQRWVSDINPSRAVSYLDWVMPILAMRKECAPLEYAMQDGKDEVCKSGVWQLFLHHQVPCFEKIKNNDVDLRLQLLHQNKLTHTMVPEWMKSQLSWQYEYPLAVQTPAKFSVSEIKRRMYTGQQVIHLEGDELAVTQMAAIAPIDDVFAQLPHWLSEEDAVITGTQRGTVLHKVMQYVTVSPEITTASLHEALADWESKGIFTNEEVRLVYMPTVLHFCQSDLGRRMAAASILHREYPFTILFEGGGVLPSVEKGDYILVQGVIDCLFKDERGWVLVDYKTDHLDSDEEFHKRYEIQLNLYKRAIEQIFAEPVSAVYVYSFYLQRIIDF
jgi:ATP-dependent helicase/nuclease subunit A